MTDESKGHHKPRRSQIPETAELVGMIGAPFTAEKLIDLFSKVKGRPCTESELQKFRDYAEKWNAGASDEELQAIEDRKP